MATATAGKWLRYTILIVSVMLFSKINGLEGVGITIIESAVAKGAVCLDGSPPAYQLDKGFGDGVNNWLVHMQWGGWCHTVENCVERKSMSNGLGSSKLMFELDFSGILSNKQDLNPNFYNWNRVIMRYCDGSSFTGDVEEVDFVNNLYYRGARVFDAINEELMSFGMKDAQNALLTGCSAGGLAAILNCDKFRDFFPSTTRVKCVPDAGYFSHVKDLSGEYHLEEYYDKIVTLHGSTKRLPLGCTSTMKPGLCFYPQFVMPFISTPIFILNSAYDTWQVYNILTSYEADPNGDFTKCKTNLNECSTSQLNRLDVFRSDFLKSVSASGNNASNGMFINTCYTHCQSETQSSWLENPASRVLDDKTISEGVGDWFYDKSEVRKIDAEHVLPHYC
uniref:pectin acetylesterase 8-like n=1 Tax=Erigeron canadensis TaxID=72917 RepID=UPI001CB99E11|nr:pectin acetylesterase 8-like [Erigeron canadensis]